MAVPFAKQGVDYFLKLYDEIIKEEKRIPSVKELKELMYNKIDPSEPVKEPVKKSCALLRDTRIKQTTLIEMNVIAPFLPDEILYTGCKAIKLYPSAQGKREGLFLPCCNPAIIAQGVCSLCLKAGLVEKYGDLDERLRQRGKEFISKNNKHEVPYEKWISESKKYDIETFKHKMKKGGLKLSIFEEKRRERTPSTSSDEEDKYTVQRTIIHNDVEYYVTFSKTICTHDGEVVGRYDDDGDAIWNF
jgi:hypothetical protein